MNYSRRSIWKPYWEHYKETTLAYDSERIEASAAFSNTPADMTAFAILADVTDQ